MGEESSEMHSEDDKALLEKNKKRKVKTRAQVEALEKFYNDHKYPSEQMKLQLAESIGLTEKQVSGWFCHRRLKDKKTMNGENNATGRQEKSSIVIQDRGSGLRQDSCGSTKLGEDRNFDMREVESGRLTPKEFSAADVTYEHGSNYAGNYNRLENASSGSSSSLRNMANDQNGDPFDVATSRYLKIPKFPTDVKGLKPKSGPSGYLKVKSHQVENPAITAVKRQLGKHYREDGPPLGVEFDPLPPGAFENSMQEPVEETQYAGEPIFPASPVAPKIHQNPKFYKGHEYKSSMASYNSTIDGTIFKKKREHDIPEGYIHPKFRPKTSLSNSGSYYPRSSSSAELPQGSGGRQGIESVRMVSVSSHHNLQPYAAKVRDEPWLRKYNDVGTKENSENEYSNLIMKGKEYHSSGDKGLSRHIIKDAKMYSDRRIINDNRIKVPVKNDLPAPKRLREDVPEQRNVKISSLMDNLPPTYQVMRSAAEMPSSFSEDDESAETSSSMD